MDVLLVFPASLMVLALGASIGSFINVVVYRLPIRLSILWPPSRCPHCLNQLKAYDNIPVLGWLLLKGRCRYCKTGISCRYPIVEGVTAILFVVVFWIFKFSVFTLGYWAFCSWLLALSLIDFDTMTLPNPLTQSGLVLGILFHLVLGFGLEASWSGLAKQVITAVVGATLGLWLFDAIAILGYFVLRKDGMGGGDIKLAAMMGAWLGWRYLLLAIFIAAVAGVLVARKRFGQKRAIPFGPFLALGAIVSLFYGKAILSTYLHLMFKVS